jgi:hypothetical protein
MASYADEGDFVPSMYTSNYIDEHDSGGSSSGSDHHSNSGSDSEDNIITNHTYTDLYPRHISQMTQYQSIDYGPDFGDTTEDKLADASPLLDMSSCRDWNSEFQRILESPTTLVEEISVRWQWCSTAAEHDAIDI